MQLDRVLNSLSSSLPFPGKVGPDDLSTSFQTELLLGFIINTFVFL